jgi:hypothetical protein
VNRIFQVEGLGERREVVRIGVHVVAVPGLAGPAMAAAVMGDAAIAARSQKCHLVFPGVCAEGPSMAEDNRLSLPPILVVNLCAVFGCDRADRLLLLRAVWRGRASFRSPGTRHGRQDGSQQADTAEQDVATRNW